MAHNAHNTHGSPDQKIVSGWTTMRRFLPYLWPRDERALRVRIVIALILVLLGKAITRAGGGRGVLVGDSIVDADAAKAANLPFVAVSFGFADRPATELGAAAVIDRYDQLLGALEGLGR